MYDGGDVVLIFDNTSAWQHRYLHGDVVDQVFMEESIGEILWGLADNQGTIRDVANYDPLTDTSAVLNHRQFDAFGGITSETNSSIEFRQSYTGGYFDEDTGLLYRWHRWYDAKTARWMSEDWIPDDVNTYRYVQNDPANRTDPTGLADQMILRPSPKTEGAYNVAVYYLNKGWISNEAPLLIGYLDPKTKLVRSWWDWSAKRPVPLDKVKAEIDKWGWGGTTDNWQKWFKDNGIDVKTSNLKNLYGKYLKGDEDYRNRMAIANRVSTMLSKDLVQGTAGGLVFANVKLIGTGASLARRSKAVRCLDDIPIMSARNVKSALPARYSKSTKWAYSIHKHHFYPTWLGGKSGGPRLRVRGLEHATDLEPALFAHMKKAIPEIRWKSESHVTRLIREGVVTQAKITDELFRFYKQRYPKLPDNVIREALSKGL